MNNTSNKSCLPQEANAAANAVLPLETYKAMWDVAPCGMIVMRPGDESLPIVIEDCNPATAKLHGFTRESLLGKSIDELQAVPWTQTIGVRWFHSLRKKPLNGTSLHRHKDGSTFLIEYTVTYFEKDGEPRALGIDRPMWDQREASTKIRETAERWVNATEASDEGVWDWDRGSDLVWISPRWNGMLGKDPFHEEVTRKSILKDVHPEDLKTLLKALADAYNGKTPRFSAEYRFRNVAGEFIWVLSRGKVIFDNRGNAIRMLGTSSEITERKRIEAELHAARIDAESANVAKSRFLATMSHEIRTPLNGVLGVSLLLDDTELDDQQRGYLKTIRESGESLLSVINDVLDYSKVEAGAIDLAQERFGVLDLIEGTFDVLVPLAAEKSLECILEIAPDVPEEAIGDEGKLRQVVLNLFGNAIKFTEDGTITLSVFLDKPSRLQESGKSKQNVLCIEVSDTGIGIEQEMLPKLFQPFSQIDASASRKYGGTGLGLVISRRIVNLMGGEIEVQSKHGHGTRFTVVLPLMTEGNSWMQGYAGLQSKRVLLLEKSGNQRESISDTLQAAGVEIVSSGRIEDCSEKLITNGKFDLAIVASDFATWNSELRQQFFSRIGREGAVPVVSLLASGEKLESGTELSAFFLRKPLKPRELIRRISRYFNRTDSASRIRRRTMELSSSAQENRDERVLLVEDNEVNSLVAANFLTKLGYCPDVAENGYEALRKAADVDYDIVFLDMHMPGINGRETYDRLKESYQKKGHRPWVIALTADALEGDREACLEAGMNDYLSKPLRPAELKEALGRVKLGSS